MSEPEIKVGQHWQEVDPRFTAPIREVIAVSEPYEMLRRNRVRVEARTVTFQSVDSGRKSVARTHGTDGKSRFLGKRGGYKLIKDAS